MDKKQILLTSEEAKLKITRLAYEIYENNIEEESLVLAGIAKNGINIAILLKEELKKISSLNIEILEVKINKLNPIESNVEGIFNLHNKSIIIVDDVANSGKTLLYAIKPFLNEIPYKIRVAVLVDRKHKRFPVTPDYVGIQLSTTLQDNIKVIFKKNDIDYVYIE